MRETALTADDFSQAENSIAHFFRWLRVICLTLIPGRAGDIQPACRTHPEPRARERIAQEEMVRSEIARLRGNPGRSAWHLRRALEACPDHIEALVRLGAYWRDRGHYDLARHYFRKAATLDPAIVRWRAHFGRIFPN